MSRVFLKFVCLELIHMAFPNCVKLSTDSPCLSACVLRVLFLFRHISCHLHEFTVSNGLYSSLILICKYNCNNEKKGAIEKNSPFPSTYGTNTYIFFFIAQTLDTFLGELKLSSFQSHKHYPP